MTTFPTYYQCLECKVYLDEEMAWCHAEKSKCAKGPLFPKPRIIECRTGRYGALKNEPREHNCYSVE